MEAPEINGVVELGRWTTLQNVEILLSPTQRSRRYHLKIRLKPQKTGKVRVRYHGRKLTDHTDMQ